MPPRSHPRRRVSLRSASTYVGVLATLLALFMVAGGNATGASPKAGSLTATSAPATWTGGPFVAPNLTGTAGAVDCTAPSSCDDYALTVRTPAGTGDTKNLQIAVSWPNTAADFDVYVLDAAGNIVASSASSSDPETVIMPPNSGTYTVRVVPYTPLGDSYSATASLVDRANDGAPASTAPRPLIANYGAPQALSNSHSAGEPSIGNNYKTGSTFYQSYLSTYKVRFTNATPPTASWTDVSASATNGCPQGSTQSLDPILYTDPTTGRTFESQLSGVDSLTCYTDDEGVTWHPSQGGGIPSGVDHQTLGGGAFVKSDPLNATNTYPRATYYCSQDIATAFCALSRDGGTTFGAGVPIYNLLDCGGLHGHVMVAPDGTTYVPNKSCNGKQGFSDSSDDGQNWTVHTVPNSLPGDNDPAVGIGANGTVYYAYANGDGTPHVTVTHNRGNSFVDDYNVGASQGIKNVVFPTAVAGDDDRAAVTFIGTKTGGNYQDINSFHGVWYLYTAFTYDGGKTWKTINDTPNDPVQRGSICTGGTTCGADRNLLDFIGSTIDSHGRLEVAYADGCTGACVTGGTNTRDAYARIARQYGGLTLRSAYDPAPNFTVSAVKTTLRANTSTIVATVKNTGTKTDATKVAFRVDGDYLDTSAMKSVPAGASVSFSVSWPTTGLHGKHTILAIADPGNTVAESNEADNRRAVTVTLQ